MTNKERSEYVYGKFFRCIKPITNAINGAGCKVGENYWFESHGDNVYMKLSDNNHYDKVIITDDELVNNFEECRHE